MLLKEIVQPDDQQQNNEQLPGTYAGVRFSDDTVNAVKEYQINNQIPNRIPRKDLHATLLYSQKHLPDYQPMGDYQEPMVGDVEQIEVWPTRDQKNCLVLRFTCDQLCERHQQLMDQHQATYDFPSYIPHMTLSYDVGNIDASQLPPYEGPIEIVREYSEDLNDVLEKNQQDQ